MLHCGNNYIVIVCWETDIHVVTASVFVVVCMRLSVFVCRSIINIYATWMMIVQQSTSLFFKIEVILILCFCVYYVNIHKFVLSAFIGLLLKGMQPIKIVLIQCWKVYPRTFSMICLVVGPVVSKNKVILIWLKACQH